jgi:hypothetical protein
LFAICRSRREFKDRLPRIRVMKAKLLLCLVTTAMTAAIVVATPAMAFHGGSGFGGGGHMMSMGGAHFGPMFAGRSMAMGSFNRAGRFDRDDRFRHFHHFRNRFVFFNGFDDFAFFGVPSAYDYAAYGNGCWRQPHTVRSGATSAIIMATVMATRSYNSQ